MPLRQPLAIEPDYSDAETSLALLAAPTRFGTSTSKTIYARAECSGVEQADESTIVDVSFRGLPLDINHRFKRFIELFDLTIVDSSADSIFPRSNHEEAKKAKKAKPGSDSDVPQGLRDLVTTQIEPKWRLCVTSVCGW